MDKSIDVIDERVRVSKLYDYYGLLLNENQRVLCESYLYDDLSLSEIAESAGISRQGVHDKIKRSLKQMEAFEERLALIKRTEKIEEQLFFIRQALLEQEDRGIKSLIEERLSCIESLL